MVVRTLAAFALVVLVVNELPAQQIDTVARVGDLLVISLTGDLATEYAKRTDGFSDGKFPAGLQIDTIAMIEQELDNGRFRFEHSRYVKTSGKPTRLVILTGNVDSKRISIDLPQKASQIAANPGAATNPTTTASQMLRLRLPDLKGLRLRTWTLSEEIGE